MNKMTKLLSLSSLLLLASESSMASIFTENHNCSAPAKPLQFVTEQDKLKFDEEVNSYRTCLETFITSQNEAMEKHSESAKKAAADWKSFVETVLGQKLVDKKAGEEKQQ